jgi:hypothetical protein
MASPVVGGASARRLAAAPGHDDETSMEEAIGFGK